MTKQIIYNSPSWIVERSMEKYALVCNGRVYAKCNESDATYLASKLNSQNRLNDCALKMLKALELVIDLGLTIPVGGRASRDVIAAIELARITVTKNTYTK